LAVTLTYVCKSALALFAVVSALMVLTQKVNWSAQPPVSFN
jgi:hypothetical protein